MTPSERLEYLRTELQAERISYAELGELQSLAAHIDPADTELLEAAGIPEFAETLVTATGITLTDPDDIAAYQAGRLTIITVDGGVAYVAERPPLDRCLIIDWDECKTGDPADQPDYCKES